MFLSKLDSLEDALKCIEDYQKVVGTEEIFINDAYKRVLAEEIVSFHDFPPFDKSTREGFAVIAENTSHSDSSFKINSYVGAGESSNKRINKNEAIAIATGAPIPKGADAVIMKEFATVYDDRVIFSESITSGKNISFKGEDVHKGESLIKPNTLIRYSEIGIIASAGYEKVKVYKKPRVKLLLTGNELVEPSKTLGSAQIINSNKYAISFLINDCGAIVESEHIKDDFLELSNNINEASKNFDIVITTGGTAISKGDMVFDAIDSVGEVLLHGVAVRPGRLFGLGLVNNTLVFNLSGRPFAAITQFDIFVRKYIFEMQGRKFDFSIVKRESMVDRKSKKGTVDFIRTYCDDSYIVNVLNRRSGMINSMINANSYIIIDENMEVVNQGDLLNVVFFNSMTW